jgi:uncharacterized protein
MWGPPYELPRQDDLLKTQHGQRFRPPPYRLGSRWGKTGQRVPSALLRREPRQPLADDDRNFQFTGQRFKAACDVDRIADHREFDMTAAADVAEDDRTTVDADADADFGLADRPRCAIVMRLMLNRVRFESRGIGPERCTSPYCSYKNCLPACVFVFTLTGMNTWDDNKRAANLAKHGVDFAAVEGFDWETALTAVDDRRDYGEDRFITIGYIGPRLHVMVWTPRGDDTRIIGLRKANDREERRYHAAQA